MVTWDIHYQTAKGLVKTAANEAVKYETVDLPALDKALTSAAGALVHSQIVMQAVGDYIEKDATPQLKGVFGHTNSAIRGTSTAIDAYSAGQVEMAATAQRNAAAAEYPEDMPGGGRSRATKD